jgi:predicted nucleic acid-binding Zn ribbon protein
MSAKQGNSRRQTLQGLTSQPVTELTASGVTELTPPRKTARRGRLPHCRWCRQPFKGSKAARYCSASCRQKAYRHRLKKAQPRTPAPPPDITPLTCPYCGDGFWSANIRGQQRYCSSSCRTLAYRARRAAAVQALADFLGITLSKAEDTVDTAGTAAIIDKLEAVGFSYDEASRRWVMAVERSGVFVRR